MCVGGAAVEAVVVCVCVCVCVWFVCTRVNGCGLGWACSGVGVCVLRGAVHMGGAGPMPFFFCCGAGARLLGSVSFFFSCDSCVGGVVLDVCRVVLGAVVRGMVCLMWCVVCGCLLVPVNCERW